MKITINKVNKWYMMPKSFGFLVYISQNLKFGDVEQ